MDCRTCQPMLLDLAHGELAPEFSAAAFEHVEGCASCRASLESLKLAVQTAGELLWLEPPPSLRVNAMAFAAQHAKQRALGAAASSAAASSFATASKASARAAVARPARVGLGQTLLDFIGRLAAGRQVAMVTIMMVVAVLGVWMVPELQHMPSGQGITVVSPDPEGEAAPTPGLAPAEPLDLAVDARSRRIRSREEMAEAANAYRVQTSEEQKAEDAPAEAEAVAAAAPSGEASPQKGNELDLDNLDSVLGDSASPSLQEGAAVGSRSAAKAKRAPDAFPKSDSEPLGGLSSGAANSAAGPRSVDDLLDRALSSAARAPSPAPSPARPAQKEARTAIAVQESAAGADSSKSALVMARELRASKGCAAALPVYQQAIKDPASKGSALIELALCQRELGNETTARALLEQASAITSVAARARGLLAETKPATAAKPKAAATSTVAEPKD